MTSTVAFIGLGAMGAHMAANLQKAGYAMRVHNRTAARMKPFIDAGAVGCANPAEAADGAEFIVSMVADDNATRGVMLGAEGVGVRAPPQVVPKRRAAHPPAWAAW